MFFYLETLNIAQCLLGLSYKLGNYGLPIDEDKAIYWIKKAASQDYITAQESLTRYYTDENVDPSQSWYWGLAAARQGSGEAMRVLAGHAINGVNCEASLCECIKWLILSASTGDRPAKEWLAELEYRLNIYKKIKFFDAYNLALKWLDIYCIFNLVLDPEFAIKFQNYNEHLIE